MPLIRPTRRDILRLAAAMPAFAMPAFAMPAAARAAIGPPVGDNPSHFRFTMGDARLTIISDGWFTQPMSGQAINADADEKLAFLKAHFLDLESNYAHTNHLYIELGDARVLVDIGSGGRFASTSGMLMGNLEAAGIDPFAITHVAMTHAHPDHIWGIRDDFDEVTLPDAEFVIGEREYAYWLQDDLVNQVPEVKQQFVVGAVNSLTADGLEWTMAADGHEVAPGIRMIPTPGHTIGHMSVQIDSGGDTLLVLGDCMTQA
ncbi:MAG TPA: MBL fold metallo-hydrolase, partial [Aliiroseovarius sp.]|nr:MBL fold metallo-hydrolase [Aliiroseovarius sp.]